MADDAKKFTFPISFANPDKDRTLRFPQRPATRNVIFPDEEDKHWRRVGRNEGPSRKWRGFVGTFIASELGEYVPGGLAWHIDDFPAGYSLWEKLRSDNLMRKDYYLYGYGGAKRFSSPMEFAFHAVWLYDEDYHDNHKCECTLCTKRKQGDINEQFMGIPSRTRRSPKRAATSPVADDFPTILPHYRNPNRLFRFTVCKVPVLKNSPRSPEDAVTKDRDDDLLSLRSFRTGELVWLSIPALAPLNRPQSHENEVIEFWPAVVRDPRIKPSAVLRVANEPHLVTQVWVYEVLLLAVGISHVVEESQLLSWQSYDMPSVVRQQLEKPRMPLEVTSKLAELEDFHPLPFANPVQPHNAILRPSGTPPVEIPRTFENALGPLSVAFATASGVAETYCLTDKYSDPSQVGSPDLYQGVWWGPERIWLHDMVRLEPTREELTVELDIADVLYPPSAGAEARAVFLRITEISYSEKHQIPCVSGRPFELQLLEESEADSESEDAGVRQTRSLSLPAHSHLTAYQLPEPPVGFKFRPIAAENHLLHLPFQTVAGRYDPLPNRSPDHRQLLSRTLNVENVKAYVDEEEMDSVNRHAIRRVLSVVGLSRASYNVILATRYVKTRDEAFKKAQRNAQKYYWERYLEMNGLSGEASGPAAKGPESGPRDGDNDSDVVMLD